jgi:hypothetical protein
MGCSAGSVSVYMLNASVTLRHAGIIAIDLARDLLQVHARAVAVVLSTENITQNWYQVRHRERLFVALTFW